jgi:hypothetical protein
MDQNLRRVSSAGLTAAASGAMGTRLRLKIRAQRERFGAARLKLCKQPVGAHVQEEPKLVGLPPRTGGLVGPRPALHVFDQVLGGAWEKAYLQSKKGQ